MPLANALLDRLPTPAQPEARYPLDVVVCPACALVQITETVPPEILFKNYLYFSSTSKTMLDHAEKSAENLRGKLHLGKESLVMEAASNDGYLLQFFIRAGVPVLGIEPAGNVAKAANERGVPTRAMFFGLETARALKDEGRQADVFLANNVLAHVADLNGFAGGMAVILKQTGTAVVEVPHVGALIEKTEFDTIYHEHLCYFSLTALVRLFEAHGLKIVDVEKLQIHGGSIRLFARKTGEPGAAVGDLLREEAKQGLTGGAAWLDFSSKVSRLRDALKKILEEIRSKGKRTAAYGAAAKGAVMLNYAGIGVDLVEYVVDKNPHKQNRLMPGTHQPVFDTRHLAADPPDYLLILAWNIKDEIMKDTRDFQARGGRYIVPVPEPKIL